MGGEIKAAIKGGLRKSAKEVLEHSDDLKKTAKNAEEAKQIDEVIEHLDEVAEVSKRINTVGSGGLLKYEKIISRNMVKQEHEMSCAAACLKQLSKDNGIELTEEAIREMAKTTLETGTYPSGMIDAFKKVFINKNIDVGMKYNPNLTDIEMAKKLSEEGSWIAFVLPKNSNSQHAVIIDKIINDKVYLRDPWPLEKTFSEGEKGIEAILDISEFEYIWRFAQNWCFRIVK